MSRWNARSKTKQRGFTLMEVMLVVGITGVIMTSAMAPMVYTVRLLQDTQKNYAQEAREREILARVFAEVAQVLPGEEQKHFLLKDAQTLLLWTLSPAFQGKSAGCVVFSIVEEGRSGEKPAGLYRWFLPNVLELEQVEVYNLDPDKGELLLAGAQTLSARVWEENEWKSDYAGGRPRALSVHLLGKEREFSRVDWFPY